MKKTLSISHTDLDGYGSQYIVKKALHQHDITFKNLDYPETEEFFRSTDFSKYNLVVITDLNLSKVILDIINECINRDRVEFIVIDHHECIGVESLPWYNLDKSCSAALGTYNYFYRDEYGNIDKGSEKLQAFAQLVSIYDIWLATDPLFNTATFLSDVVFSMPLV